ncbi:hypothetical protein [Cupriavidus sp. SIMBA_020]|uniref:hypothetical protein n=1 Tax=Cupriavidus sp. SIMBA_020 TaxID=3085766 RepID=UPI00397C3222
MTMNLDALERAAVAGTMKWRDAHALVSMARQLLRLRAVARDFYNTTVANPELRLSASNKKVRDEAIQAGERLRESLEATAPGAALQNEHAENMPIISANSAELAPGTLPYPTEPTDALLDVLGLMLYTTTPIAHALRAAGTDIPKRCEEEQAHVLHWLIQLALQHGVQWRERARNRIEELQAATQSSGEVGQ